MARILQIDFIISICVCLVDLIGTKEVIPGADGIKSFEIAAEVGLLTRNIKIVGVDSTKESFGARLLVGTYSDGTRAFTGM